MKTKEEIKFEDSLRPLSLNDYIGQNKIKELLEIYIKATKMRNETLDHVLLYGPPGLGKTTLAQIIANELDQNMKVLSASAIEKTGDVVAVLATLEPGDVLFIDEIHRLPKYIEELLYQAMEDYVIDIIVGKEVNVKTFRVELNPFTLIGATTRIAELSSPFRDRFGVIEKLDFYSIDDLRLIAKRTANFFETSISDEALLLLATRSRGTPRVLNRLFRRVRDFALVKTNGVITSEICEYALKKLDVDETGLNISDINYLTCLVIKYEGGPVGLNVIASTIQEEASTIEDVYEPFLIKEGYIIRTARGRIATNKAIETIKRS